MAKTWYAQKTFWVGIITIGAGLVESFFQTGDFQFTFSFVGNDKVLAGLAMIVGRSAIEKVIRGKEK